VLTFAKRWFNDPWNIGHYLLAFFTFAQRAFCAAAILARPSGDIVHFSAITGAVATRALFEPPLVSGGGRPGQNVLHFLQTGNFGVYLSDYFFRIHRLILIPQCSEMRRWI
jgi:hypothetical protein